MFSNQPSCLFRLRRLFCLRSLHRLHRLHRLRSLRRLRNIMGNLQLRVALVVGFIFHHQGFTLSV
jgi:hypothetical protein